MMSVGSKASSNGWKVALGSSHRGVREPDRLWFVPHIPLGTGQGGSVHSVVPRPTDRRGASIDHLEASLRNKRTFSLTPT